MTPQTLLRQAREGGPDALGLLLQVYARHLEGLAHRRVGPRVRVKAAPDDVVQETFLAAHRAFRRFRGTTDAEFAGWLRRILAVTVALVVRKYTTGRRDVRLERRLAADADGSARAAVRRPGAEPGPSEHRAMH
jgi:RNA polymerase sigma-70 factor (ECF subfamily)